LSGSVYVEDEEQVEELLRDINNIHEQIFDDSDGDSTQYSYDSVEIELEEESITGHLPSPNPIPNPVQELPKYYLFDIHLI
jgi:hypothetical protein